MRASSLYRFSYRSLPSGRLCRGRRVRSIPQQNTARHSCDALLSELTLSGAQGDPPYFQISVPVQRGNSGGALVDIAMGLYKRQRVSLGCAADFAGMGPAEFLSELGPRRIPINHGVEDLRSDVATLKSLS